MTAIQSTRTIAIIGVGASGTLAAAQFIRQTQEPLRLLLIERRPVTGLGIAYSTTNIHHTLNVPAGNMSAYPDQPDHLLRWLQQQENLPAELLPITPKTFVPRYWYGKYLQAVMAEALASTDQVEIEWVHDEAISITATRYGVWIELKSDRQLFAQQAILSVGNFPPGNPPVSTQTFYQSARYVSDPWAPNALTDIDPDKPVILLGTGLTAVDVTVSLYDQGHRGPIISVSRRGLPPQAHTTQPLTPTHFNRQDIPETVRTLVRWTRQEVQKAIESGNDWRSTIDALRPHTQDIWRSLPLEEKARFARHVVPYWDIRRHRIAPNVGAIIDQMRATGQLHFYAARVQSYQTEQNAVVVRLRMRRTHQETVIQAGQVINCTGPISDIRRVHHPLLSKLLEQGHIQPGPLNMGLAVTPEGALINAEGKSSTQLWTMGSLKKGSLWETIAVPELREQAAQLAHNVLKAREKISI